MTASSGTIGNGATSGIIIITGRRDRYVDNARSSVDLAAVGIARKWLNEEIREMCGQRGVGRKKTVRLFAQHATDC